jgi:hypothetical protein
MLERVLVARLEATQLLLLRNREPEIYYRHSVLIEHMLEFLDLLNEPLILRFGAEAVDRLDHSAVVPATVEEHYLAPVRELFRIPLKIPLALSFFRRLGQGDDPHARVEVFGESADSAAFACCVAAFEEYGDSPVVVLNPSLKFHKFDLRLG